MKALLKLLPKGKGTKSMIWSMISTVVAARLGIEIDWIYELYQQYKLSADTGLFATLITQASTALQGRDRAEENHKVELDTVKQELDRHKIIITEFENDGVMDPAMFKGFIATNDTSEDNIL